MHISLTGNVGEFTAIGFTQRLDKLGIDRYRVSRRLPNTNAVVDQLHQTMLEECW